MKTDVLSGWIEEGKKLNPKSDAPGMPVHVLLAEATATAGFVEARWACQFDAQGRMTQTGLELANGPMSPKGSKGHGRFWGQAGRALE